MATLTSHSHSHSATPSNDNSQQSPGFDPLRPLRRWIDQVPVKSHRLAHLICQVIPCCCPFERDFSLLGRTLHIPPLCKLNPVYDELVNLRFRALSYLSDICGEDITQYIC